MIRVACSGPRGLAPCGRVRGELGWHGPLPGEDMSKLQAGICPTCLAIQKRRAEVQWAREGRRLLRERAIGNGPAPEGEDVFRGFREER